MIRVIIFNMCSVDENCINENYKNFGVNTKEEKQKYK